jgi:hypothetical protein
MMRIPIRNIAVGFALVACGIMAANLLTDLAPPNTRLMFPVWVLLCLIPAYWYGRRLGIVSYAPREILATIGVVLAAIVAVELWDRIRPFSAMALAALVCVFFLFRKRWLRR